jgi:hypothetical protein
VRIASRSTMDWAEQLISAPASLLLHDAYRVLTTWIGGTSRAQTAAEVLQDDERQHVAETVDLPAAGPDQALSGARRSQFVHPLAAGGGADVGQHSGTCFNARWGPATAWPWPGSPPRLQTGHRCRDGPEGAHGRGEPAGRVAGAAASSVATFVQTEVLIATISPTALQGLATLLGLALLVTVADAV